MSLSVTSFQRFLKVAILLLLLTSFAYYLWIDDSLVALPEYWANPAVWSTLLVVCMLMPLNWSVEAIKWQYLINTITPITFLRSCKAVLAGVSFALFTPNRMGEYLGRVWLLPPHFRIRGILLTLVNSFAQIIVTGGLGIAGLVVWLIGSPAAYSNVVVILGIATLAVMVVIYFQLPGLVARLGYWRPVWKRRKWFRVLRVLQHIPLRHLQVILAYAFLRYTIYAFQYVLLLHVFTQVPLAHIIVAVPVLFFFQMGIPVPAILEIGVRGSLATNLLATYQAPATGVLVAATTLWVVNLLVPAAIGGLIIATNKVKE